jgi:hypothetical protein
VLDFIAEGEVLGVVGGKLFLRRAECEWEKEDEQGDGKPHGQEDRMNQEIRKAGNMNLECGEVE